MADLKYYDVILKPVVTEKSMSGMGDKKYTFLVNPDATKNQIKDAVENSLNSFVEKLSTFLNTLSLRVFPSFAATLADKSITKIADTILANAIPII